MLEHASIYYPNSLKIKQKLIKLYSKLGLIYSLTKIFKSKEFDIDVMLDVVQYQNLDYILDYKQKYENKLFQIKSEITRAYEQLDLDLIYNLIQTEEQYKLNSNYLKIANNIVLIQKRHKAEIIE